MESVQFVTMKKAIGSRGSWFALVDDERLPCIHKYWWTKGRYNDTGLRSCLQADELVDAIREKQRVILTTGNPVRDENGQIIRFERTGYVAIFSVDSIEFDECGLRFKFLKRLDDLA